MRKCDRTQWGLGLSCLLLIVYLSVQFIGCDEAPFAPKDDEPVVKDYKVWYWNSADGHFLFHYHTRTHEICRDTIDWEITADFTVSHDGRRLYLPTDQSITVIDTDTFGFIATIPLSTRRAPVVSLDGQLIAILGDSVRVIRTDDYSQVYIDTIPSHRAWFSANSENLYTVSGNVKKTNLTDPLNISSTIIIEQSGLVQAIPTPDESKLLLWMLVSMYTDAFAIYDIQQERHTLYDFLTPGVGRIAMTPDGRKAYYGNPGNIQSGPAEPSEFTEVSIVDNRIVKRIGTANFVDSITPSRMPIGNIVITPDGRYLVGAKGPMGTSLLQYDLTEEVFTDYQDLEYLAWNLTMQTKP